MSIKILPKNMKNDFYVYTWTRPDTGEVFYIGKGTGERAWRRKIHNPIFMRIVSKLDASGLKPIVKKIAIGLSEEEAFEVEAKEISERGRICLGTGSLANITDGGEGASGVMFTQERKDRISEILRERFKDDGLRKIWSDTQKKRYSDPAEREAVSLRNVLRYSDPLEREKTSLAMRGLKKSPEHISAVTSSLRGLWESGEMGDLIRTSIVAAPPGRANTSGYKGVSFDRATGKWLAQIQVNRRNKHLGRHANKEDAARSYDKAAKEYFGAGAYQNFPESDNDNHATTEQEAADKAEELVKKWIAGE